ncbi:FtsW/RodA/SpoVE family cell cycle protein [Caproiciproducens galactitolivorans]|uniref:Probable peptidoglycan glycosyltransferase FtsW n=1 Tax=Caproiciproducens galactitolivorans TaxID=642589 RepID=A0ABT4BPJ0_9FIRM|nr:putative peptidoglycan glycosyltransferase FtsW [Caproiciproducens galactitolivorans]MCY1712755.1 putative peptidoglycan glycosyltransferase FtsW [Caproiciproducens galactitolivorans]
MTGTKPKNNTAPRQQKQKEQTEKPKGIRKKFRVFSARSGLDMPFLFLVLTLLIIGLIMLFSASFANALYRHGSSYFFISRQAFFAVLGVAAMIAISYFDYHHLHKFAIPILLFSYMLLAIVLFMKPISGVHRWISLGPLGQFQPSELAKFALILVFSHLISLNFKRMDTFRYGVLPYILILGSMTGLMVLEPHVSATVICVLLAAVMLFIGGVRLRWFGLAFGGAGAVVAYLVLFTKKFSYANDRIIAWLDPFSNASKAIMEDTWQTRQSLYAIGSGGLLGLGLGQSRQKYLYLPEPQNDFIFAIVCEELGFIGALIIIILFAMLVWRGISISLKAKDKFGMLLGIGLVVQVGLQVVLNIAVVTNTIPNTGISLPFFSYGGTSLVLLLAEMGVVLSISRTSAIEKT